MKRVIIKCYRCGERFEGESFDKVARKHNLKKKGKFYYCECKKVGKTTNPKDEEKKKVTNKYFGSSDNGDIQE